MIDDKKIKDIKKSAEQKSRSQKYFTLFLVCITAVFFLIMAFLHLFNINKVVINGVTTSTPYKEEEILAFLDLVDDTNLLTYDTYSASRSLVLEFPYIDEAKLKKKFPNTLIVEITANEDALYVTLGQDTFILSPSGRVLEIVDSPSYDGQRRAKLLVNGIKRCVCGENIVFEEESTGDTLIQITEKLQEYDLLSKITEIDIMDKFDVRLMYDNRFEIIFGTPGNAENKIKLFSSMMQNKIWEDTTGIIDISNGSEALVKFTGNVAN